MIYSKILSTGAALPEQILTNADLEKMVDTTDEWITRRVGIKQRHIIGETGETNQSLAIKAAKQALEDSGLKPNDIGMIVVGTVTGDDFFPSCACAVQEALGIDNDCPAFDIAAACAGFIYALSIVDQYIKSGAVKNALVIGSETLTQMVGWEDRSTSVLFGDGAGAIVVQASDEPGIVLTHIHAAGQYGEMLKSESTLWDVGSKPKVHMDGREVFKLAVTKLGDIVDQTLEKAGIDKSDIDWLIPHQANLRIIQAVAKRLNMPMERVVLTVEHHGNTSAASIPLALDHAVRSGQVKRGETLLCEAFGAGLAWGSALIKY